MTAIYHCLDARSAASLNKDRPIREMVGTMTSGPIKCRNRPMTPLKPMTISKSDETMMAP